MPLESSPHKRLYSKTPLFLFPGQISLEEQIRASSLGEFPKQLHYPSEPKGLMNGIRLPSLDF